MKALTQVLKRRTESDSRDFLPALLEIVERPPSPAKIAMASTICIGALAALLWAILGQVDLVAVARGKVQPSGRVRLVQAVEFGKVQAIHVRDGSTVKQGDLILELESEDVRAEVLATRLALFSARAESARRSAAVLLARETMEQIAPQMPEDIPAAIAARETLLFFAERDSLRTQIDHIDSQISQKRVDRERLSGLIAAQQALLAIQKERVSMRNALLPSGAGTRASMMDAEESLRYQETILAGYEGDLRSTEQMAQVLTAERARAFPHSSPNSARE